MEELAELEEQVALEQLVRLPGIHSIAMCKVWSVNSAKEDKLNTSFSSYILFKPSNFCCFDDDLVSLKKPQQFMICRG